MKVNINQIVSISEANQNFSKVARMTDKYGELYIFKNNKPKYKLIDIENDNAIEMSDDEKIDFVADRIMRMYAPAFRELAKSADSDTEASELLTHSDNAASEDDGNGAARSTFTVSVNTNVRLTVEKVLVLHEIMAEETGGSESVRDMELLGSALSSPFSTFDGIELYPTREEKAARLCHSLISNHAFVDGNKRIGMFVLLVFLEVNGVKLRPTNSEVARVGLALASGEMRYDSLLDWIIENE